MTKLVLLSACWFSLAYFFAISCCYFPNAPTISSVDRQRLVSAIEQGATLKAAAAILQVPIATAYRIMRAYTQEGRVQALPRGGKMESKCKSDENLKIWSSPVYGRKGEFSSVSEFSFSFWLSKRLCSLAARFTQKIVKFIAIIVLNVQIII